MFVYSEYDPVVPMELAQYSSENSQDIVMPPIKCMKWHYDTIQEVHKRRYLLRVRWKKIVVLIIQKFENHLVHVYDSQAIFPFTISILYVLLHCMTTFC